MLRSLGRKHYTYLRRAPSPEDVGFPSSGRTYRPSISFPSFQWKQIPLAAKVAAGVVGAVWIGYSTLYFARVQTCESAFQQVHPKIPKAECKERKVERQLLKDLLADVPSGPICVQGNDASKSSEFLLSIVSGRPASIRLDAHRWETMSPSEISTELSRDLRVFHIFTKQKLQELLSTFLNTRSDAGGMKDLTILLATATKALEEIKKIDPEQHHAPVIYVNGLVECVKDESKPWKDVFRTWCLQIANQGLAHVVFASKMEDLNRPLASDSQAINLLTLNDLSQEDAKQVLLNKLLTVAAGNNPAMKEKIVVPPGSSTIQVGFNGTIIDQPQPQSQETTQASELQTNGAAAAAATAAKSAGGLTQEEPSPQAVKLQQVIDIVVDLLGGDTTSIAELTELARTHARSHRMKATVTADATTESPRVIDEMDVWLLESLRELLQRHWLRTVNTLSDLYETPTHAQLPNHTYSHQQALDSLRSIVSVSSQRIRLLYSLRELSLHGSIPAPKFFKTLLEGDEQLFKTLIARQVIRLKLSNNVLPLTRVSTADEGAGHLQVVCGSEVVRRALQYMLLLGNSPATNSLHQLPSAHASLQKIADPTWVRYVAKDDEELQASLRAATRTSDGSDIGSDAEMKRKMTSNQQLRQWAQLQVHLTSKLGSWLSSSPTVSQWRDIVHNFPAQYGIVTSGADSSSVTISSTSSLPRDPRTSSTRVAASINKLAAFNEGVSVQDIQQLLGSVGKFYSVRQIENAVKTLNQNAFDEPAALDGEDILLFLEDPATFEARRTQHLRKWYKHQPNQVSNTQPKGLLLTSAALCDGPSCDETATKAA